MPPLNGILIHGGTNIVKKLVNGNYKKEHIDKYHDSGLCTSAAKHGHFDCLKYLYENNYNASSLTLSEAINHCNIDVVKWLINKCEIEPKDFYIEKAIRCGKLDTLKYLLTLDIKLYFVDVCCVAIQCKQLEIFEELVKNNHLKDMNTILYYINNEKFYTLDEKEKVMNIIANN